MGKRTTEPEDLTVTEAAAALSTTPMAILMLLRRDELRGREISDGEWRVDRESLQARVAVRRSDAPLVECHSRCAAKAGGCASCGSTAD